MHVVRINWVKGARSLGSNYGTYEFEGIQETELNKIREFFQQEHFYAEWSDKCRTDSEHFQDFNRDLVLAWFGFDINYY